jgi:hypothetical protein
MILFQRCHMSPPLLRSSSLYLNIYKPLTLAFRFCSLWLMTTWQPGSKFCDFWWYRKNYGAGCWIVLLAYLYLVHRLWHNTSIFGLFSGTGFLWHFYVLNRRKMYLKDVARCNWNFIEPFSKILHFVVKFCTLPVDRDTMSDVWGYTPALMRPATADWKPAL